MSNNEWEKELAAKVIGLLVILTWDYTCTHDKENEVYTHTFTAKQDNDTEEPGSLG